MTAVFLLAAAFGAQAQTALELDGVLQERTVGRALGARFILGAADLLPRDLSGPEAREAAWSAALARGWIRGAPEDALRVRAAAFLVMNAFEFRGGIWYSLFHTPRYAYREMVYRKVIPGRADPDQVVSGEDLMRLVSAAMRHAEGLGWKGGDPVLDMEVEQGQGLSSGPEDTLPYKGEFEVE
jgi:hypothetical protein